MKRGLLLLPIVLGLLLPLLLPELVEACACCDFVSKRTPVAWSKAGDQVLVHSVDRSGCGRRYAVEYWRVGESSPSACHDLLGDPSVVLPCSELRNGNVGENLALTPLAIKDFVLPPGFVIPASLSPHAVRLGGKAERRSTGTMRSGVGVVEVQWNGSWLPLWHGTVIQADRYPADNSGPYPMPLVVTLLPSPVGGRALLTIDNAFGGNFWTTAFVWVELPKPEPSP